MELLKLQRFFCGSVYSNYCYELCAYMLQHCTKQKTKLHNFDMHLSIIASPYPAPRIVKPTVQ